MSTATSLFGAAVELIRRGRPIVICDGKVPLGGKAWHKQVVTEQDLPRLFQQAREPAIGIKLGPDSVIDIEADGPSEEQLVGTLFEGCEPLVTPTYQSTRGKHRLYRFDDRLRGTGRAVINFSNGNGAKLGIRIGADGMGAQSVIPPSPGRKWLVSWDEVEPAPLPDAVVARILAAARPQPQPGDKKQQRGDNKLHRGDINQQALTAMLRIWPSEKENDGSNRLFAVCCRAVEHNLADAMAVATIRAYERSHQFPAAWSDGDIIRRLRDAERKAERGSAVEHPIRNRTDYGNAERFAEQHGSDVRYCHPWKKWLCWDGRRWAIDDSGRVMRRAKHTTRKIYVEASRAPDQQAAQALAKWAAASERRERLTAMITLAESERPIPIVLESLDAQPWLLNCKNGTIDLHTGELREHRREDYLTKLCPVEYPTEPGDDPELWLAFLNRILAKELIGFLQRLVGMALVGEVLEHVLPIFHGGGANGKTVFLETVCGMLGGDYAMNAPAGLLMATKSDRHPTALADLHGKRLVAAVETADGGRLSEALVKELTGGDSIRAHRMREDFWQFRPSHTAVLATNHKPTIRGTDLGIWRRIRLVPFVVTIPDREQDKQLAVKLRTEWPVILRWAVAGCLDWQRNGLQPPAEVLHATESYRADMDVLGEFIEDRCVVKDECEAQASDLYHAYKRWCEGRGEHAETQTRFGTRLVDRGYDKRRNTRNGRIYYHGIGLIPEGSE